jgi:hypothetical protein
MADTGLKTNFSAPRRLPDTIDHLVTAAEAAFIDVPFAALKRMAGVGDEREVYAAGWKAYDALINSASEAINRLYTDERYLRFAGRTLDVTLGVYRLNTAVAGAFFATLWPAIGIPTAADVEGLREELHSLREEYSAARAAAAEERVERAPAATRPADGVLARPAWDRWTVSNGAEVKASVGN